MVQASYNKIPVIYRNAPDCHLHPMLDAGPGQEEQTARALVPLLYVDRVRVVSEAGCVLLEGEAVGVAGGGAGRGGGRGGPTGDQLSAGALGAQQTLACDMRVLTASEMRGLPPEMQRALMMQLTTIRPGEKKSNIIFREFYEPWPP